MTIRFENEKHLESMMLPAPCFTVWMVFIEVWPVVGLCQGSCAFIHLFLSTGYAIVNMQCSWNGVRCTFTPHPARVLCKSFRVTVGLTVPSLTSLCLLSTDPAVLTGTSNHLDRILHLIPKLWNFTLSWTEVVLSRKWEFFRFHIWWSIISPRVLVQTISSIWCFSLGVNPTQNTICGLSRE